MLTPSETWKNEKEYSCVHWISSHNPYKNASRPIWGRHPRLKTIFLYAIFTNLRYNWGLEKIHGTVCFTIDKNKTFPRKQNLTCAHMAFM